jgi:hypothetical protein
MSSLNPKPLHTTLQKLLESSPPKKIQTTLLQSLSETSGEEQETLLLLLEPLFPKTLLLHFLGSVWLREIELVYVSVHESRFGPTSKTMKRWSTSRGGSTNWCRNDAGNRRKSDRINVHALLYISTFTYFNENYAPRTSPASFSSIWISPSLTFAECRIHALALSTTSCQTLRSLADCVSKNLIASAVAQRLPLFSQLRSGVVSASSLSFASKPRMGMLSRTASTLSSEKDPLNVCRSMRALVLCENRSVPTSEVMRAAGGLLDGEYDMVTLDSSKGILLSFGWSDRKGIELMDRAEYGCQNSRMKHTFKIIGCGLSDADDG